MKRIGKLCVLGLLLVSAAGCSKKNIEQESRTSSSETSIQSERITEAATVKRETNETETITETKKESKIKETKQTEQTEQAKQTKQAEQVQNEMNEAANDKKSSITKEEYLKSLEYAYDLEKVVTEALYQQDMHISAGEAYTAWDYELNRIYGLLKDVLSSEQMEDLITDELNWITERDAEIEEAGQEFAGGSMEPTTRAITGYNLTRERTLELIDMYFAETTP